MVPTHSGSPSHAHDARHCCGRSKQNIYHRCSSRKARPRQRLIRARQLSFRLAPRAGDGSDPAFSHLCLLPAPLTGGPGPPCHGLGGQHQVRASLGFQRRFRGAPVGSGFIKGRTAYRGYLSAFAFFLPTFAPLCLRAFLASCSPTQAAPYLHRETGSLAHPRRFQSEEELKTVRRLLGWSAQETG